MILKFTVTILLLFASVGVTLSQSKKEKALELAIEQLRRAMIDADSIGLSRATSEKLSYGHSSGIVEDKAAFIGRIVNGHSDFETIDLSETKIVFSGSTAVVRQNLDAITKDNGKAGEAHLFLLMVWTKEGGQWKLLARQAVKKQA